MTLVNTIAAVLLITVLVTSVLLRRRMKQSLDDAEGLIGVARTVDLKDGAAVECRLGKRT